MGNCLGGFLAAPLLQGHISRLHSSDPFERVQSLRDLTSRFTKLFDWNRTLGPFQDYALDSGLVEALICVVMAGKGGIEEQELSLNALKWICLDNKVLFAFFVCHEI